MAGYCAGAVARGPVLIPITGMAGGDLMGFDAMALFGYARKLARTNPEKRISHA